MCFFFCLFCGVINFIFGMPAKVFYLLVHLVSICPGTEGRQMEGRQWKNLVENITLVSPLGRGREIQRCQHSGEQIFGAFLPVPKESLCNVAASSIQLTAVKLF